MAPSPPQDQKTYTFGSTEWSNYLRYRPQYPPSLTTLIRTYHTQHSNAQNLAHDVASGSGVFVPTLHEALPFQHIHVSDPGPSNLTTAHATLSKWLQSQPEDNRPTLTFSRTTGEELHTTTALSSVDLITVMEAAHWMSASALMDSAYKALRSGGTLALVLYCARVYVRDNSRADRAFKDAFDALWRHVFETKRERDGGSSGLADLERGLRQASVGLDFVPLDERWVDGRRMRIRGEGKGEYPFDVSYTEEHHWAESMLREEEKERYERYEDGDWQAVGWDATVDKDWFKGYLCSMESPEYVVRMPEFVELMKILEEEYPDGKRIEVEWVTDVVLASKK